LSYDEVMAKNLRVMDQTAVAFCRETKLPICVFKLAPGRLKAALTGQGQGTLISA
jgi:uridylate kinase